MTISFPMLGKFLTLIFKYFSDRFSSSSGIPTNQMLLLHLMLSQRSLRLPYFFSFFFLHSVLQKYFHRSIFQLIYPFFCSGSLLLIPSSVFFISVIALFIRDYSLVLLGPCYLVDPCLYSISEILDHLYYNTLNCFSVRLSISSLHLLGPLGFYLAPSSAIFFLLSQFV